MEEIKVRALFFYVAAGFYTELDSNSEIQAFFKCASRGWVGGGCVCGGGTHFFQYDTNQKWLKPNKLHSFGTHQKIHF